MPTIFQLSDLNGANGFFVQSPDSGAAATLQMISGAGDFNGDGFADILLTSGNISGVAGSNSGGGYVLFGTGDGFSTEIELSNLNGSNGFRLFGAAAGELAGGHPFADLSGYRSSGTAGDFNGDGLDDIIIGAPLADIAAGGDAGRTYIVYGFTGGFGPVNFELSSLNGTNGFVLNGTGGGDLTGLSVSGGGDFNNDGYGDVLIGSQSPIANGITYLVYGGSSGFGSAFDLTSLNGTNGFRLFSPHGGENANVLDSRGDFNGDGREDLAIGAWGYDRGSTSQMVGRAFVVFGADSNPSGTKFLSSLNSSEGFFVSGDEASSRVGSGVALAGDVNGDGFDDLFVFGRETVDEGKEFAHVIYGNSSGLPGNIRTTALNGVNGFSLTSASNAGGKSVDMAGDFNGDGVDDLIIASHQYAGAIVVFGNSGGFGASFDLDSVDGVNGFVLDAGYDLSDASFPAHKVAGVGDVNGDGFDDIGVISTKGFNGASPDITFAYFIFGGAVSVGSPGSISDWRPSIAAAVAAASPGDLVSIGAGATDLGAPATINVDDLTIGFAESIPLLSLALSGAATTLTVFRGGNISIAGAAAAELISVDTETSLVEAGGGADSVSGGDGADNFGGGDGGDLLNGAGGGDTLRGGGGNDTLIGGSGGDVLTGSSGSDLVDYSGSVASVSVNLLTGATGGSDAIGDVLTGIERLQGTTFNDTLTGANDANTLDGGAGNDRLFGKGGSDVLNGGEGMDTIAGDAGDDKIDGGSGADSLEGWAGRDSLLGGDDNDILFGFGSHDSLYGGNGDDDLRGNEGKDLLGGSAGDDVARGGIGDDRLFGGGGSDTLLGNDDNDSLIGGGGGDRLKGDDGNDTLVGSFGADTVTGGAGDDEFFFRTTHGGDEFDDFAAGAGTDDYIRLVAFGAAFDTFAEVIAAASDNGTHTTIDFGGGDTITLLNILVADLHEDDFLFG